MKAVTIKALLDYLPTGVPVFRMPSWDPSNENSKLEQFAYCYSKPSFPWVYVQTLAKRNIDFPHHLVDWVEDEILFKAYLRESKKETFPELDSALVLLTDTYKNIKAVINALLVCEGSTVDSVSNYTGISREAVEVYEKLFFNILDRKKEDFFLANIVYPNGRLVEIYKEYANLVDSESLLLRSAYNNGPEDVLYLGGLRQGRDHLNTVSLEEAVSKLESIIMVNGYILARNGFVNQASQSMPGVASARNLIAAAKQAGLNAGDSNSMFSSLSESIKQSLTMPQLEHQQIN